MLGIVEDSSDLYIYKESEEESPAGEKNSMRDDLVIVFLDFLSGSCSADSSIRIGRRNPSWMMQRQEMYAKHTTRRGDWHEIFPVLMVP